MFLILCMILGCESKDDTLLGDSTLPGNIPDWDECFVAGTEITMGNGLPKLIEDVRIGDVVTSRDIRSGETVHKRVTDVLSSSSNIIYTIKTASTVIDGVTGGHPFYVNQTEDWLRVEELMVGVELTVHQRGRTRQEPILDIDVVELHRPVDVYNFTAEGPQHNYFANDVLVHNKSLAESVYIVFISPENNAVLSEGNQAFEAILYIFNDESDPLDFAITWTQNVDSIMADDATPIDSCTDAVVVQTSEEYQEFTLSCTTYVPVGTGIVSVFASGLTLGDDSSVSFTVE
jgi:hypothetical protein